MSRIHDALQRAQRERYAAAPPVAPHEPAVLPGEILGARPPDARVLPLPERKLRHARFSLNASGALARPYASVERFCELHRGPALEGQAPLRLLVMAGREPEVNPAPAALALGVALAEKTKSRVVLVDGVAGERRLAELFEPERESPSRERVPLPHDRDLGIWRTDLAGLYFLPSVAALIEGHGSPAGDPLEHAFTFLREHFGYLVVPVGSPFDESRAGRVAAMADAFLLVARDLETALREPSTLPLAELPSYVFEEVP